MVLSPNRHELLSIFGLGIALVLATSGYDAQSFIAESVLHSVHVRNPSRIDAYAGYYGPTVMYSCYALTTLVAPWICYKLGSKWTLIAGSIPFTLYLSGFLYLNAYFYYLSQMLLGAGIALYYAGQGQYVAEHSTRKTISRNSVLMSAIGNQSVVLGGFILIIIYLINPPSTVSNDVHSFRNFSDSEIFVIFSSLVISAILSNIVFACLPSKQHNSLAQQEPSHHATFTKQIGLLWKTVTEVKILILLPFFIYYGLHLAFWLMIFPTSFAFSHHLASNYMFPAFYSISVGLGNIIIGVFLAHMSKRNSSFGLIPTMFVQLGLSVCMYIVTVLCTPNHATMYPTTENSLLIEPSVVTVLLLGFLHGMIDCCSCTMRSFMCTIIVPKRRLQVFCVSKLFQAMATCLGTFIAPKISIYGWMLILISTQILSSVCFWYVSKKTYKIEEANNNKPRNIGDS